MRRIPEENEGFARQDLQVLAAVAGRCQPLELARQLKADANLHSVTLIGFFSHVETALQEAAEAAGYDRVMPRSAFTKNLAQILSGEF